MASQKKTDGVSELAEVFDTTEVPQEDGDDEDVEALMEALYGATQETNNWCKDNNLGVDEEQQAEEEEQEVEEEYVEYDPTDEPLYDTPMPQQGENFLGFLELSAAGKRENFKNDEAAPTWKDELHRTAEAAAANVEALTDKAMDDLKKGSKRADYNFTSASRFLAFGIMLTSVITLCAKMSMVNEDTAADSVTKAMASASVKHLEVSKEEFKQKNVTDADAVEELRLQKIKEQIVSTSDANKLDATGEFGTSSAEEAELPAKPVEPEKPVPAYLKNKRKEKEVYCADSSHPLAQSEDDEFGHGKNLYCKDLAFDCNHPENGKMISKLCPVSCGICKATLNDDVHKVFEMAKALAEKEAANSPHSAVDADVRSIIEAAKLLEAKEEEKQAEFKKKEDEIMKKLSKIKEKGISAHSKPTAEEEAAEAANKEATKKIMKDAVEKNTPEPVKEKTPEEIAEEKEEMERKKKQDEATLKAAAAESEKLEHEAYLAKKEAEKEAKRKKAEQYEENKKAKLAKIEAEKEKARRKTDEFKGKQEEPVAKAPKAEPKQSIHAAAQTAPDAKAECMAWAKAGECKNNQVWMQENCATSCVQHYIADLSPKCAQWANDGECEKNHVYMSHHCPASCGAMNAPAPAPKAAKSAKAKRAAEQSKPAVKASVVRGKVTSNADEDDNADLGDDTDEDEVDTTSASKWLDGKVAGAKTAPPAFKHKEDSLLDLLATIPSE